MLGIGTRSAECAHHPPLMGALFRDFLILNHKQTNHSAQSHSVTGEEKAPPCRRSGRETQRHWHQPAAPLGASRAHGNRHLALSFPGHAGRTAPSFCWDPRQVSESRAYRPRFHDIRSGCTSLQLTWRSSQGRPWRSQSCLQPFAFPPAALRMGATSGPARWAAWSSPKATERRAGRPG